MDISKQYEIQRAVERLKARYCRLMDTRQWHDWGQVFARDAHMDVSDDVSPETGEPVLRGRDRILGQVQRLIGDSISVHQVHSPEIDILSATSARGIWAMSDMVTWPEGVEPPVPGLSTLHGYGYYHEEYVIEDGRWRITSLRLQRLHWILA